MSRARYIKLPKALVEDPEEDRIWFDTNLNGAKAKPQHLELLALVEDIDLDDLLDEHIVQATVIERLRDALGQNNIPEDIIQRREEWRAQRHTEEPCRICDAEGDSTRHHFVNRWILKELVDYAWKWSPRVRNCIPVCIRCHRNLHEREGPAKSIVEYLNDEERAFVQAALEALGKERPSLFVLLVCGDDSVYESKLLKDYALGFFRHTEAEQIIPAKVREEVTSAAVV